METVVTTPAATGGAGTATAVASLPIAPKGWLEAIAYSYSSAPGTTTITIAEADGAQRTIATIPAGNTAGVVYPRAAAVNTAGAAITNSFAKIYLSGHEITVTVGAANNGSTVTVRLIYAESYWE